jgi:hypothetical protein
MAEVNPTTKAQLDKAAEARKASQDKAVKMMEQSKPTPTQEENDLAKMGVDVVEKEDDGSGQDPHAPPTGEPLDKAASKPAPQRQAPPPPSRSTS